MNEIIFTPISVLDFLSQIDELSSYDLDLIESDGYIQFRVGDSLYTINSDQISEVETSDDTIEDIQEIIDDEYQDIENIDSTEYIESGIIKEVAKTLLVGGLVRLTSKLLKKK